MKRLQSHFEMAFRLISDHGPTKIGLESELPTVARVGLGQFTCCQSMALKNTCVMMSANPVCGWQPNRSFGSWNESDRREKSINTWPWEMYEHVTQWGEEVSAFQTSSPDSPCSENLWGLKRPWQRGTWEFWSAFRGWLGRGEKRKVGWHTRPQVLHLITQAKMCAGEALHRSSSRTSLRRCYTGQLATPTCSDTMLREK